MTVKRSSANASTRQVLEHVHDDPVVLGPEPLVVDDTGGQRIGVPVAEPEHSLLDRGAEIGRHLAPVALPQGHEMQQVEVARVLEAVDLVEGRLEVRRSDAPQVEVERPVTGGPGRKRQHVGGRGAIQRLSRVVEIAVLTMLPPVLVHVAIALAERSASAGPRRRCPARPPSPRGGTRPECSPVVARPSRRRPAPQWPNAVFLAPVTHPRPAARPGSARGLSVLPDGALEDAERRLQ